MNGRLGSSQRIKKQSDYLKVLRGKKRTGRFLAVYWCVNDHEHSRFGFIVGKKVSKRAVDRNRLKRFLKEFCRRNKNLFPENTDFVFRMLPPAGQASHNEIDNETAWLLEKIASEISSDSAN